MEKKKRGILSRVLEFAGKKRAYFGGSVVLAMLGVAASFVPYATAYCPPMTGIKLIYIYGNLGF